MFGRTYLLSTVLLFCGSCSLLVDSLEKDEAIVVDASTEPTDADITGATADAMPVGDASSARSIAKEVTPAKGVAPTTCAAQTCNVLCDGDNACSAGVCCEGATCDQASCSEVNGGSCACNL